MGSPLSVPPTLPVGPGPSVGLSDPGIPSRSGWTFALLGSVATEGILPPQLVSELPTPLRPTRPPPLSSLCRPSEFWTLVTAPDLSSYEYANVVDLYPNSTKEEEKNQVY